MASDEEARLRQFCKVVTSAIERRAIRDGTIGAGWSISGSQGEEIELTTDLGDEDDALALMSIMRQLVMAKERVHFYAITNIIERCLATEESELLVACRSNREHWKQAMGGARAVALNLNGSTYRGVECFELYAYGGLFHSDRNRVAAWDSLGDFGQAMVRAEVNYFMTEALHAAFLQRNLIEEAFTRGALRFNET